MRSPRNPTTQELFPHFDGNGFADGGCVYFLVMSPLLRKIDDLLREVTQWGATLTRKDVPYAYPGGHRLPLFRQRSMEKATDIERDSLRLLQRRDDFLRSQGISIVLSEIVETERGLARKDPDYRCGQYLSLLRLAMDLREAAVTGLTVIERRTFHLARRRLLSLQASERPLETESVVAFLSILEENSPQRLRGLADAFRVIQENTRHPLVGLPHLAGTRQLQLVLNSCLAAQSSRQEVSVLCAFLGARAVLASNNIHLARTSALLDSSLDAGQAFFQELLQWLGESSWGGETFALCGDLAASEFVSHGRSRDAIELVQSAACRVLETGHSAGAVLEALERTFYRRVYKQEGAKHLQATALEPRFAEILASHLRHAMRMPKPSHVAVEEGLPPCGQNMSELLARAELLDRSRAGAWTPSGLRAVALLLKEDREDGEDWAVVEAAFSEGNPSFLAGSDELLRFLLECRGYLDEAVMVLSSRDRKALACWFLELWKSAFHLESVDAPRRHALPRRLRQMLAPLAPLEWACAASMAPISSRTIPWQQEDPLAWIRSRSPWVSENLPNWRERLPWEVGLQGIWSQGFAGIFFGGLEEGLRAALRSGAPPSSLAIEAKTRFVLLETEMGYRAWLGARERFDLFLAAFHGHEGQALAADSSALADVQP